MPRPRPRGAMRRLAHHLAPPLAPDGRLPRAGWRLPPSGRLRLRDAAHDGPTGGSAGRSRHVRAGAGRRLAHQRSRAAGCRMLRRADRPPRQRVGGPRRRHRATTPDRLEPR